MRSATIDRTLGAATGAAALDARAAGGLPTAGPATPAARPGDPGAPTAAHPLRHGTGILYGVGRALHGVRVFLSTAFQVVVLGDSEGSLHGGRDRRDGAAQRGC